MLDFLREFVKQEYVRAALGVLVGYGVSFLPVPPEIRVAVAAILTGLIGFWAAYKANKAYRANKALLQAIAQKSMAIDRTSKAK